MRVIIDTGPWIALIDRSEESHKKCVEWFQQYEGEIFSTEPVLTEVLYLLNFSSTAQISALDFVINGAITIVPSSIGSLTEVKELMKKYRDFPMDFVDGTLIELANDLGIDTIVTLDRKHFNAYRLNKGRVFFIIP